MIYDPEVEVSIITPVFNGAKYLDSAADSVFSQTFGNFEWIIINDCSLDSSLVRIHALAEKDSRVKVYNHDVNKGPIHTRNTGFTNARGRFIAFLDVDDCWLPEKLEKQIAFMKEKKAGLSYTGYSKISLDGSKISDVVMYVPEKINRHSILKTCSIMASSAVFDRSITGEITQDITAPQKDDLHLWVRILKMTDYAYGLQENLSLLRISTDSFTGNKFKEARNQWIFYRRSLEFNMAKTLFYFSNYAVKGTCKYILLRFVS